MRRILIILPYFGKLNTAGYFPLFLQSCRANASIDFLLLTDDETRYEYPQNMRVVYTTLPKLKERFQKHFDFNLSLEQPYKLCDYKLAYGELFCEEIEGYGAWGFCDLDIIFGNLEHFLTEERFKQYARIYTRGHLGVFRADVPRDYYRQSLSGRPDYREVFSTPKSYSFDEWVNQDSRWDPLAALGYESCLAIDNFDVSPPCRTTPYAFHRANSSRDPELSAYERRVRSNVLYYRNGTLSRIGLLDGRSIICDELAYAHFQKRRLKLKLKNKWDELIIVPNCIRSTRRAPQNRLDIFWHSISITRLQFYGDAWKRKCSSWFGGMQ